MGKKNPNFDEEDAPLCPVVEVEPPYEVADKFGCKESCGDVEIPFPIGIQVGCYKSKWFRVTCNRTADGEKPFISNINMQLLNVSFYDGTVIANNSIIYSDCPGRDRKNNGVSAIDCGNLATFLRSSTHGTRIHGCKQPACCNTMTSTVSCSTNTPPGLSSFDANITRGLCVLGEESGTLCSPDGRYCRTSLSQRHLCVCTSDNFKDYDYLSTDACQVPINQSEATTVQPSPQVQHHAVVTSFRLPTANHQVQVLFCAVPSDYEILDFNHPVYLHLSDTPGTMLVSQSLTGIENNGVWSRSMRIALLTKNKVRIIDGSCQRSSIPEALRAQWDRCNTVKLYWILNSVSKERSVGIVFASSAALVWQDLQEHFNKVDGSRIFFFAPRDWYDLSGAYSMIDQEESQRSHLSSIVHEATALFSSSFKGSGSDGVASQGLVITVMFVVTRKISVTG
ncbi:Detected protein of unknown function [Hibiscus syriacus]|uniref:Wall-associated receptor kinase galacturonan-binding domain-containing protein n=1 Tax=Hibiscus syriacus TaxID=106335 RepID=A0A6A3CYW4_HIBSY|nr:Detected protein of unknown function [Hibiscus syriacus]